MTLKVNLSNKTTTKEQKMEDARLAIFSVVKALHHQISAGLSSVETMMTQSSHYTIEEIREYLGEDATSLDDVALKAGILLASVDIESTAAGEDD